MPLIIMFIKDLGLAYGKFIAFTAHIFNEHRQMELTAAGYFKAVGVICFLHPKADICV